VQRVQIEHAIVNDIRIQLAHKRTQRQAVAAPGARGRFGDIFRGRLLPLTVAVTLMNACTLFAWWGFNTWVPAYLRSLGFSTQAMSTLIIINQVGMWFGYVTFGFISDAVGRKRAYVTYLLAAALLLALYASTSQTLVLLALGPLVAFFGTGYFSGFGAVTAEIYPTDVRATAQGFTYNIGRVVSAAAPFTVASLAQSHGFGSAFTVAASAVVIAALVWIWIPETRGRKLD
jgi:MFS family permease